MHGDVAGGEDPWVAMPSGMVAPMWAPGVVGAAPGMPVPVQLPSRSTTPGWVPMPMYPQQYPQHGGAPRQGGNASWFF